MCLGRLQRDRRYIRYNIYMAGTGRDSGTERKSVKRVFILF